MSDTLINHHSSISICNCIRIEISNLRFDDDIDLINGNNDKLQQLNYLSKHTSDYDIEISSEKSKTMVNSRDENVHANIRKNGEILEDVGKFKYLGATITKFGTSEADIRIRLATSTSTLIRLQNIWTSKNWL